MYCTNCGAYNQDGAHFCQNCGASLQAPNAVQQRPYIPPYTYPNEEQPKDGYEAPSPQRRQPRRANTGAGPTRTPRPKDPYQQQIRELRLQLRQLKLYLRQVNQQMSSTRANYYETNAFLPGFMLRAGHKLIEDMQLLGPQQQKEQLQRQIMQMEQQLLGLEQAQEQWRQQNGV